MDAKNIFLEKEGDAWFARNKVQLKAEKVTTGINILEEFINREKKTEQLSFFSKSKWKILEIGSSSGYNLSYLEERYNCECYGIEPSLEAVNEGKENYKGRAIELVQGTADDLPYKDNEFDVVILGFCMFWIDRKYLMKAYAEADRVLKEGGLMVITDFDTEIPFKRLNKHNEYINTFKMNYANFLLNTPQYYLIEKKSYSHLGPFFHRDLQERISTQILFKEKVDDAYHRDE